MTPNVNLTSIKDISPMVANMSIRGKIQLLPDLDLEKTPQLDECVADNQDVEELMSPPPKKILLQWMNFKLRKIDYNKTMTNFSSDAEDGEAYALRI
ncbi:fimbrin-2 [Tanacetum coccineum]